MSRQERSYLADLAPEKSTANLRSAKGQKATAKAEAKVHLLFSLMPNEHLHQYIYVFLWEFIVGMIFLSKIDILEDNYIFYFANKMNEKSSKC